MNKPCLIFHKILIFKLLVESFARQNGSAVTGSDGESSRLFARRVLSFCPTLRILVVYVLFHSESTLKYVKCFIYIQDSNIAVLSRK